MWCRPSWGRASRNGRGCSDADGSVIPSTRCDGLPAGAADRDWAFRLGQRPGGLGSGGGQECRASAAAPFAPDFFAAPYNGSSISHGLGPTYGETVVRRTGSRFEHRQPAGRAARTHPVRGIRLSARAVQDRSRSSGRPAADDLLGHYQDRRRSGPVRRHRQRDGDPRAARRLQQLGRLPGVGSHRPIRCADSARVLHERRRSRSSWRTTSMATRKRARTP